MLECNDNYCRAASIGNENPLSSWVGTLKKGPKFGPARGGPGNRKPCKGPGALT